MGKRAPSTRHRMKWILRTGTGDNYIDLRLFPLRGISYVGVQLFIGCARSRMAKKSITINSMPNNIARIPYLLPLFNWLAMRTL